MKKTGLKYKCTRELKDDKMGVVFEEGKEYEELLIDEVKCLIHKGFNVEVEHFIFRFFFTPVTEE